MNWGGAGAFVERPGNISPEWLGETMAANGFSWAAVLVHNGLQLENEAELEGGWRQRLAAHGVTVGAWGPLREAPEEEAALAVRLVQRYGLEFYVANAEYEYEYSGAGGASNERAGRSGRFAAAFRAAAPDLPAAMSTFGRFDHHDIDWAAWRNAGFHFLPQAYPNEHESLTVPLCVEGARHALASPPLDLSAITHPTIGVYPGARGAVSAAEYVEQLSAGGARGFSLYLAERMTDPADWRTFGEAIRAGRILVGEAPEPEPEPEPRPPGPSAVQTKRLMVELAGAMEAEWTRQGLAPEAIARRRISIARLVLESPDKLWEAGRDEIRALLTPPDEG